MYKIVGADQREYGPVPEEQLRQWIAEGRANAQSLARTDDGPWKALASFPEFRAALGLSQVTPGASPEAGAPPAPSAQSSPPPPRPPAPAPTPLPLSTPPLRTPPATSGMAIAGLVCSILGVTCGLVCCGPLFSTLGLIFSVIALVQINQEPLRYSGRGMAIAGIVLALVGYVLFAAVFSTGIFRRTFRRRFPRFF
jgi:hypothetical protein